MAIIIICTDGGYYLAITQYLNSSLTGHRVYNCFRFTLLAMIWALYTNILFSMRGIIVANIRQSATLSRSITL